jgi:hypothetical protein
MKEVLPLMKIAFRIGEGGIYSAIGKANSCCVLPSEMVFLLLGKLEGVRAEEEDKRGAG